MALRTGPRNPTTPGDIGPIDGMSFEFGAYYAER